MVNYFRVINFRGFHYPQNFFSNEVFPDYGMLWAAYMPKNICMTKTLSFKYMYLLFYLTSMLLRGSEVAT